MTEVDREIWSRELIFACLLRKIGHYIFTEKTEHSWSSPYSLIFYLDLGALSIYNPYFLNYTWTTATSKLKDFNIPTQQLSTLLDLLLFFSHILCFSGLRTNRHHSTVFLSIYYFSKYFSLDRGQVTQPIE